MKEEKSKKKILPQPGIELTTTWWSKKLMNFQLKLYHWATKASYREWQLAIAKLKFVCFLLVFYSSKYKKAKASKNSDFSTNPSLNFKIFCHSNVYLLVAVTSSGILKAKQKLGITFNSDNLGGIESYT